MTDRKRWNKDEYEDGERREDVEGQQQMMNDCILLVDGSLGLSSAVREVSQ